MDTRFRGGKRNADLPLRCQLKVSLALARIGALVVLLFSNACVGSLDACLALDRYCLLTIG